MRVSVSIDLLNLAYLQVSLESIELEFLFLFALFFGFLSKCEINYFEDFLNGR